MIFIDTSEGIKTDHPDQYQYCCANQKKDILKLCPLTLHTLQNFTLIFV